MAKVIQLAGPAHIDRGPRPTMSLEEQCRLSHALGVWREAVAARYLQAPSEEPRWLASERLFQRHLEAIG